MPYDGSKHSQDDAVLALLSDADQRLKTPEFWIRGDFGDGPEYCLLGAIDWVHSNETNPTHIAGKYLLNALPKDAHRYVPYDSEDEADVIFESVSAFNDDTTFNRVKNVLNRAIKKRVEDLHKEPAVQAAPVIKSFPADFAETHQNYFRPPLSKH